MRSWWTTRFTPWERKTSWRMVRDKETVTIPAKEKATIKKLLAVMTWMRWRTKKRRLDEGSFRESDRSHYLNW